MYSEIKAGNACNALVAEYLARKFHGGGATIHTELSPFLKENLPALAQRERRHCSNTTTATTSTVKSTSAVADMKAIAEQSSQPFSPTQPSSASAGASLPTAFPNGDLPNIIINRTDANRIGVSVNDKRPRSLKRAAAGKRNARCEEGDVERMGGVSSIKNAGIGPCARGQLTSDISQSAEDRATHPHDDIGTGTKNASICRGRQRYPTLARTSNENGRNEDDDPFRRRPRRKRREEGAAIDATRGWSISAGSTAEHDKPRRVVTSTSLTTLSLRSPYECQRRRGRRGNDEVERCVSFHFRSCRSCLFERFSSGRSSHGVEG